MIDVATIINRAFATSSANDPNVTAAPEELVWVVDDAVRDAYNVAFEENPWYFAKEAVVDPGGPENGWERPAEALDVLYLEAGAPAGSDGVLTARTEVWTVPIDDKIESADPPRVYRLGKAYHSVGKKGDPVPLADTGDRLIFTIAHGHTALTSLNQVLDDHWIERHNALLVFAVAAFLAAKDKGRPDRGVYEEQLDKQTALFRADIRRTDSTLVGRFARQHREESSRAV